MSCYNYYCSWKYKIIWEIKITPLFTLQKIFSPLLPLPFFFFFLPVMMTLIGMWCGGQREFFIIALHTYKHQDTHQSYRSYYRITITCICKFQTNAQLLLPVSSLRWEPQSFQSSGKLWEFSDLIFRHWLLYATWKYSAGKPCKVLTWVRGNSLFHSTQSKA